MEFVTDSPPIELDHIQHWEISADPHRKNEVIEKIIEFLVRDEKLSAQDVFRYRLCLDEAITNSITHGCPDGGGAVEIDFYCSDGAWAMRVVDQGPGFSPRDIPGPEAGGEDEEHGRGLAILGEFADAITWARGGREMVIRVEMKANA